MPLPPARYQLLRWPSGPQVAYDSPAEILGLFLSARNMTLGLEHLLDQMRCDADASSADNATRADRTEDTIRLSGEWGPEEIELPFAEFDAAAEEFLTWIRGRPAAPSDDLWVVLAWWLAGAITADEATRRLRTIELMDAAGHAMRREDSDAYLRGLAERFGDQGRPEALERLACALAVSVANLEIDPRAGAAAIAQLAARLPEGDEGAAALIRPFVALSTAADDAEGDPTVVAEVEHRIADAAERLARARTR
jgi:hypothetical protein